MTDCVLQTTDRADVQDYHLLLDAVSRTMFRASGARVEYPVEVGPHAVCSVLFTLAADAEAEDAAVRARGAAATEQLVELARETPAAVLLLSQDRPTAHVAAELLRRSRANILGHE